jgi:ATP-binding cassette subfamily B protein
MSIKDNLLLVKPDATKKELDDVCKKVDIYDYMMSLPKKYNTIVGTDGVNLSGSQKQKLSIARALLKNSKILIFDEATSMIDKETQTEIHEAITKITKDLTVIFVSHRLDTLVNCDKILVIDKGRVVAEGKHKNLITNCKTYKNLFKKI